VPTANTSKQHGPSGAGPSADVDAETQLVTASFGPVGRPLSMVLDLTPGVPTILYWGTSIFSQGASDSHLIKALRETPLPHGGLDVVAPLSLVPEHGSGFLGRPGIEGARPDGSAWSPRFSGPTVDIAQADSSVRVTTTSVDPIADLELTCFVELHASGLAMISAQLRNTSDTAPYDLQSLRLSVPLPGEAVETMTFGGRWCNEFAPLRTPLHYGVQTVENRTGRTSHGRMPIAFAGSAGFSEAAGEVRAVHVAWSGNSVIDLEAMTDGRRRMAAGELLFPGEISLAPGESYRTPTMYLGYATNGLNGITEQFYAYIRSRRQHPRSARPASLNTWEAVYFNHDLSTLTKLADAAASIGMERYVLDDGWFHGRRHDRAGLGDWWVDATVWPNGLAPLIEHVRGLGLEFGIWLEPEMVNPDSDLYRSHPDWVLTEPGYEPVLGRHQLALNLSRPDVRDYLFGHIDRLLADHDISYVKWDMNRELVHASNEGRSSAHEQTKGLYDLWDRLVAAHPTVEFETCASGGGRIDLGIFERASRAWTSDCQDALERQRIQRGFSYLFPPELMGAHIASPRSHTTRRTQSLAFRCGTALFGHVGIEWNLLSTTDDERQSLRAFIETYKRLRPLLHGGTTVRFDYPHTSAWAHGAIAPDMSEAVVAFVQLDTAVEPMMTPLRIPGLDPDRLYSVRQVALPGPIPDPSRRQPAWITSGLTATGVQLAHVGIQPPVLDPESLIVLHITTA
jgi:alpha-galactosidase